VPLVFALEWKEDPVKRIIAFASAVALVGGAVLVVSSVQAQRGPLGNASPFPSQHVEEIKWVDSLAKGIEQASGGGPPSKKDGPRGPKKGGPKVGSQAPDFELKFLDAQETFKLSDNFGKSPTVLIFHSFT